MFRTKIYHLVFIFIYRGAIKSVLIAILTPICCEISISLKYTGALISQLRGWSNFLKVEKLKLYILEEEPQTFSDRFIKILFKEIHSVMDIEEDSEISFEVNPLNMFRNSSIEEYFFDLNHLGVNRISVGAQSFDDTSLKRIGRRHSLKRLVVPDGGVQNFQKCKCRFNVWFAEGKIK